LQRPFLRQIYDQDFVLLKNVAAAVDRFGGKASQVGGIEQSWKQIFEDAEAILYREIDYRDEAANGVRICRDFGIARHGRAVKSAARSRANETLPSAAHWLRAPTVYDELCTEKVLVMEFVPSIKITKLDKLKEAGVKMRDREYLADSLARAYLRQFCCNLFFSTDPHAGNLGVEILDSSAKLPEDRVRLVLYDFGQAAELNRQQADGILDVIEAIVDSDVEKSIISFEKMGVLKDDADLGKVRAKVSDNFKTGKIKANRKRLSQRGYKFAPPQETNVTDTGEAAATPQDSEIMQYFSLPAEYAFVARALAQMDGVGKVLDPEFDFVSAAAPWIVEIKGATKYLLDEAKKYLSTFQENLRSLLPTYVDRPAKS
jgi:predicted unusual protein kinase regulating ubiquinone biosynthesis (AarF/ABC1/UbiB family)